MSEKYGETCHTSPIKMMATSLVVSTRMASRVRVPRAENFGDTKDHKVLSEGCESPHTLRHVDTVADEETSMKRQRCTSKN